MSAKAADDMPLVSAMKVGRPLLLFVLVSVIWGATWIALKAALTTVPPVFFAGTRFVAAGAGLYLLLLWRRMPVRVARTDWARLAVVSVLIIAAPYALLFWGAAYVSSGLAAILNLSFMPAAILAVAAALGEDRFTPMRGLGVAVGVAGLLVLFGPQALTESGGGTMELIGGAAVLLSSLLYPFGSVLARPLLRAYSPTLVSAATMLAGGLLQLVLALAFEPGALHASLGHWGREAWAGWWFLVLFGSLIAYTAYLHLVAIWGNTKAAAYAFVSPIIAAVLGVLIFGETISASEAAGMAIMLAGAWLVLRPDEAKEGQGFALDPLEPEAPDPHP